MKKNKREPSVSTMYHGGERERGGALLTANRVAIKVLLSRVRGWK